MNLARHAAVLWRFRVVTAAGLVLGVVLAILASYSVSFSGGPGFVARGTSTYNSESQILVTQNGFPEGRVTLPDTTPVETDAAGEKVKPDPNQLEYGDPNRFMALADLYTQFVTSDEVRARVPEKPQLTQITASALPATSGAPILPIISLATTADTAEGAHELNLHVLEALRNVIEEQQAEAGIQPVARVRLDVLKAAQTGSLLSGPSHTGSILALLLCVIGTIAVTHMLAALRPLPDEKPSADALDWIEPEATEVKDKTPPPHEAEAARRLATVRSGPPADSGYWGAR